ncbi:MAG: hypothetical protein AAF497_20765, partial [Planctomycetota bacterium]
EMAQNARWEALLLGRDFDAANYHAQLTKIADARGVVYLPAQQVSELPTASLLTRIETATDDISVARVLRKPGAFAGSHRRVR